MDDAIYAAVVSAPIGVVVGVAAEAFWNVGSYVFRLLTRTQIRITLPRPDEILPERQPHGKNGNQGMYKVQGKYKRILEGHEIWLLVHNPETKETWPQSVRPIVQDVPDRGDWYGYVVVGDKERSEVVAVVAPPTANQLFSYYRMCGEKTGWRGLSDIPPECTNRFKVLVRTI